MGFFTAEQYQRTAPRISTVASCGLCKLHKNCRTPKIQPTGMGKKGILFITDTPEEVEDTGNEFLKSEIGNKLDNFLTRLKMDLHRDCRKISAVNCRPKNTTKGVTEKAIEACRPMVLNEIKKNKPRIIIPLGLGALKSIIGHRWKMDGLGEYSRWRGFTIPDRELGCWICPISPPNPQTPESAKAVIFYFRQDLKHAFDVFQNKPFPKFKEEATGVTQLTETSDITQYLQQINRKPPPIAAFDYETTGLKPHSTGHRIVSCAVSTDPHTATAFPVSPAILPSLCLFLQNPSIRKVAANLKFEEIWSRVRAGTKVSGWLWDTMLVNHCLDNRKSITSLKFQAYVRYGIIDYDSHINLFLRGVESDNANSLNRIHEIPLPDLLTYNGIDSMLELRLSLDQMATMGISDPIQFACNGNRGDA